MKPNESSSNKAKVCIEIDAAKLSTLLTVTGTKDHSQAILAAIDRFLLDQDQREQFIQKVLRGETDYQASAEELRTPFFRGD